MITSSSKLATWKFASNVLGRLPALWRVKESSTFRRILYTLDPPFPYARLIPERKEMEPIVRMNREALSRVTNWIDDETYEHSIFKYGLPSPLRPLLDRPMADELTYSDLIIYLSRGLPISPRYLELGVSVGKNFFQMMNGLKNADLVGFDIEDINPKLEAFLEVDRETVWDTIADSIRKNKSSIKQYRCLSNENRVTYLAGDIFDRGAWKRLYGRRFNLIFSDAFHSADALRKEYEALRDFDLIDTTAFIIIWDDLGSREMRAEFNSIAADLRTRCGLSPDSVSLELVRGWLGHNEPHHPIGIVRHLPDRGCA